MLIGKNWLGQLYREELNQDGGEGGGSEQQTNNDEQIVANMASDTPTTDNTERPEWLMDKYATDGKSVLDATNEQAKAYSELSGKFGAFTGAPENYEVSISDELKELGVEIANDDPMLVDAMKFAKDSNMSQEGFAGLVNLYAMQQVAEHKADAEFKEEQIKALGPNGDSRIKNIQQWAGKNLDAETVKGLEGMATNVEAVKTIERLISMTRNSPVDIGDAQPTPGSTKEDVARMQFEKDEFGNRRINTDPEFKARYHKMRNEVYGTEENRIMVG